MDVAPTKRITRNLFEVLQLPRSSRRRLVLPSLTLLILHPQISTNIPTLRKLNTNLNSSLLSARSLKVTFPNPLRDSMPKLPALPLTLLLNGLHRDLLLGRRHIVEDQTI